MNTQNWQVPHTLSLNAPSQTPTDARRAGTPGRFAGLVGRVAALLALRAPHSPDPVTSYEDSSMDHWYQELAAYEAVSFDVFDTALLRTVLEPDDVFLLAAEQCGLMEPQTFKTLRRRAQSRAYKHARLHGHPEVSLTAIYAQMADICELDAAALSLAREAELEAELAVVRANPPIQALIERLLAGGTRVVFVSDMYLPHATVAALLAQAGYSGYERLFVSSDHMATKHDGTLYPLVLDALGLEPGQMAHVGDNYHSDVAQAQAAGLHARHFPKTLDVARAQADPRFAPRRLNSSAESALAALALNRFYAARPTEALSATNFWHRFGYSYVGPLFYGFTHWLIDNARADGVDHLFFLSRDGYILQQVFDIFETHGLAETSHSYLYASRRAFNFPLITHIDEDALHFLSSSYSGLTVADYVERINLDPTEHGRSIRAAGFQDLHHVVTEATDPVHLHRLFELLEEPIVARATLERDLLVRYLEQEGFFRPGKVAVVDVGWKGTMQKSLNRLCEMLDRPVDMVGYYLGTTRPGGPGSRTMRGYLIDNNQPYARQMFVWEGTQIIEFTLSAPHGSVLHYKPVPGDEARLEAVCASEDMQDSYRRAALAALHQGALEFVAEMCAVTGCRPVTLDEALAPLVRLVMQPTRLEAELLGDVRTTDTFGNIKLESYHYLAHPETALGHWPSPAHLLHEYMAALWPLGYLARSDAHPAYKSAIRLLRSTRKLVRDLRHAVHA